MTLFQPPISPARLIELMKHPEPFTREWCALALGRASRLTEDVHVALGKALFDPEDDVCIAAGIALVGNGIHSKPALPHLLKALKHRHVKVRCLVAATLAAIGPDARNAVPVLISQLKSSDTLERYWAGVALKSIQAETEEKGEEKEEKLQRKENKGENKGKGKQRGRI